MEDQDIEIGDLVRLEVEKGIWTVVGTRSEEPKYRVQLGMDAGTIKYVRSDVTALVEKAAKPDAVPGFYPDRSILG